jgi:hypothetical protein
VGIACAVVVWAVCALASGIAPRAAGATNATAGATATPHGGDSLTLVRQTPWVGPNPADDTLALYLRVTSSAPPQDLKLTITIYKPLIGRSTFDETMAGRALGAVVARSPALPVTALATDPQGVTHITIPVAGDTSPTTTGDWSADLGCTPGSCADVYPLKVVLTDTRAGTATATGAQFITYLIYNDPAPKSEPLRFAMVAPLGLAPPVADATTGNVPAPNAASVQRLESAVNAVGASGAVPLTIVPDPATLQHLAGYGHARAVSAIAALSTSASRQTVASPYVPVDATALVDSGLPSELASEIRRGGQVLATPTIGVRSTPGTWVVTGGIDAATVAALAPTYGHLVVPPSAVSGPNGPLTISQPFTLLSAHGSAPTAVVSDPGLGAHLAAGQGNDPALAAEQLLADLSLVYYEAPNLQFGGVPAPRGVVGVAPSAWAPDPAFLTPLLESLQGDPIVQPVTLDQLFAQVPVGASHQATSRRPVAGPAATVPARAVRTARSAVDSFASAVVPSTSGMDDAQALEDVLLASEGSTLSPRQQRAALLGFDRALATRLHLLAVRADNIRLTSSAASVPVTVLRDTPYPLVANVSLTSAKLVFSSGAPQSPGSSCRPPLVENTASRSSYTTLCTLDHPTNAVSVNMRSRTSGDFRIDVTVTSPQGTLVLTSGQLTVRSTSTSAVAIALSAGAAAVLLAWWARTLWRGRRSRPAAHARGASRPSASS